MEPLRISRQVQRLVHRPEMYTVITGQHLASLVRKGGGLNGTVGWGGGQNGTARGRLKGCGA